MEKFRVYGERSEQPTALELANRSLAREAAAEGFVLLKNEGALPLKDKKLALYGAGARLTVKGGSGSGDVHERYSVSIEKGLKNAGFEILSTAWLERFTKQYEADKAAFRAKVEDAIKGYKMWQVMAMFRKIGEFKLAYPVGDEIKENDLVSCDTCVYVVARQAGEGDDRKTEKGDFLLADAEVRNIETCAKHYRNVVLVVNCGGMVDLSPVEKLVSAIVYYGQAGEEGGNALADVLSGKISPSGKLTDTWGMTYSDYPTAHFKQTERLEEDYFEGIYVGYRWFEAQQIAPRYPFGFGLSYTTFACAFESISEENGRVTVKVSVKNTGKTAGKEVVQVYLAKPNQKYGGEKKGLVAFRKTKLLAAGEGETLSLSFGLADSATYDEKRAAYVLEAGEYGVFVGTSSQNAAPCAAVRVESELLTEQCKNCCTRKRPFEDLVLPCEKTDYTGLPFVTVKGIETVRHDYKNALPPVSPKVQKYLGTLSDEELARFCMGGGYFTKQFNRADGSCGNTTSVLVKKGIPNLLMADGPAGINLIQKAACSKRGGIKYIDALPEQWQWGWLKTFIPKLKFLFAKEKDIHIYQYCTAWPNATTLAQTWNPALVEKVGEGVGKEMCVMGITLWLAPALNIHRDPLCGRNFEYYSEDPLIAGEMAAAVTRGVQSAGGVGVTIKHFACNNRENDRTKVSSNLSERALREIYLKGFRIAVKAQPMALMSSYNRINGTYAPNSRELLTDILRCEWGYKGLVMSDWDAVDQCSYTEAVKCGNNMIMPGRKDIYKKLCEALKKGELKREDVLYSAAYALNAVFAAATSRGF